MTDLQGSLLLIGGAIVIGVISYNKWQEYKTKKTVERAFSSSHDDVLMAPERESEAELGTGSKAGDIARQEPTLDGMRAAVA
ncbi:MAG: cell division protein, partial [Herbaspirillum sp.]